LKCKRSVYYFTQLLGIIHRDIKPANILLSNSIPKFADFGFAVCKYVPSNNTSNYNVGTPLYMAPESLLQNTYSYKSDIWSLGVVLFEMLYGKTPFYSPDETQLKKKLKEYETHSQIPLPNESIPQSILAIIAGMLAYEPSKRWNLQ
jgi:serine/threonine protein kinase